MKVLKPKNDNKANSGDQEAISVFDVKALYDAAYEEKAKARVNIKLFRSLMAEAIKLDAAYRDQLRQNQDKPFQYGGVL